MKILLLASGLGTHFDNLYEAIVKKTLNATIVSVASDKKDAPVLQKAKNTNTPYYCFTHDPIMQPTLFFNECMTLYRAYQPDLWVLAGFMKLLPAIFIKRFYPYILNIHPSLLPEFKGLNTHARALEAGKKTHGATVHIVTEKMDSGPILAQAALAIHPHDTAFTLQQRVKTLEYELYRQVLQSLATDRISLAPFIAYDSDIR